MHQDIVTWKGELYFVDEPTADPVKLEGSLVAFYKNGKIQGIAYRYSHLALTTSAVAVTPLHAIHVATVTSPCDISNRAGDLQLGIYTACA